MVSVLAQPVKAYGAAPGARCGSPRPTHDAWRKRRYRATSSNILPARLPIALTSLMARAQAMTCTDRLSRGTPARLAADPVPGLDK